MSWTMPAENLGAETRLDGIPPRGLHPRRDRRRGPRGPLHLGQRRPRRGRVRARGHGRGPGRRRDRRATTSTGASKSAPRNSTTPGCATSAPPSSPTTPGNSPRSTGSSTAGEPRTGRPGTRTRRSARRSPKWAASQRIASTLVNEGGGIHVDGEGTVLATETVQLDAGRNPGITKAEVEAEFARTLGATKVHWLPRGLTRDSEEFGTRGHVDIVATIPSPGNVLVHTQHNPNTRTTRSAAKSSPPSTGPPTPPAARSTSSRSPPPPRCATRKGSSTTATSTTWSSTAASSPARSTTPTTRRPWPCWPTPTRDARSSASTPASSSPAAAASTASPSRNQSQRTTSHEPVHAEASRATPGRPPRPRAWCAARAWRPASWGSSPR